jgi:hypothetical protein
MHVTHDRRRKTPPSRVRGHALLLAAALIAPGAAGGQNVPLAGNEFPPPSRLWWELTVGGAASRLSCDICEPERENGPSADLALGAYASPRLRVGVQGGAWTHDDEGVRETVFRAGVLAQLHPRSSSGFLLLAGLGWSGYRAGTFGTDAARLTLGAGWDLPLAPGWVVGNSVALDAAAFGSLKREETTLARGVGLSVARLGVYLRRR